MVPTIEPVVEVLLNGLLALVVAGTTLYVDEQQWCAIRRLACVPCTLASRLLGRSEASKAASTDLDQGAYPGADQVADSQAGDQPKDIQREGAPTDESVARELLHAASRKLREDQVDIGGDDGSPPGSLASLSEPPASGVAPSLPGTWAATT